MERLGDAFDEQRFGEARRAGEEAMSAGEEGDEQLLDRFLLTDDDFGKFGFDFGGSCLEMLHSFLIVVQFGRFI